jgi:hypothetical protein
VKRRSGAPQNQKGRITDEFGGGGWRPSAHPYAVGLMISSGPRSRSLSLGIVYIVTTAGWLIIGVLMATRIVDGDTGPNGGNWFQLVLAAVLTPLFAGMAVHQYRLSNRRVEDADGVPSDASDVS